jgi:hypothetical protein
MQLHYLDDEKAYIIVDEVTMIDPDGDALTGQLAGRAWLPQFNSSWSGAGWGPGKDNAVRFKDLGEARDRLRKLQAGLND